MESKHLKTQRCQQKTDVICYGMTLKVLKIREIRFAKWMDGRVSNVRLIQKLFKLKQIILEILDVMESQHLSQLLKIVLC